MAGAGADFGVPAVIGRRKLTLIDWPIAIIPVAVDGQRGRPRADALDQGRVDAAVDDPEGLAQLVADGDPGAGVLGVVVEALGAEQGGEVRAAVRAVLGHAAADPTRSRALSSTRHADA